MSNPYADARVIGRQQALFWLNEHLGEYVEISVMINVGGYDVSPVDIFGELHHWREVHPEVARLDPEGRREDLEGFYHVGATAALDLSDPNTPCSYSLERVSHPETESPLFGGTVVPALDHEWLRISLSDDVEISVHPKGTPDGAEIRERWEES